jgi:hypothetical protein
VKAELSGPQQREIQRQVARFLDRTPSFSRLPSAQQREITQATAQVVAALAEGKPRGTGDPYAQVMASWTGSGGTWDDDPHARSGKIVGDAAKLLKDKKMEFGEGIGVGVTQAARMVKEINFPSFVASLIEGTFHAIVKSSIEQMQAYAEMVKSVSSSLNEFKDKNTSDNQARDHLVSKYPRLMQITVINNEPRAQLRPDADLDNLPDFAKELGLPEDISDLDDETIENTLVPAARDDLARGRQQLLATIILMGINRIIVTDGKINAKIRFQFSANEKRQTRAQAYDYAFMGTKVTSTSQTEENYQGSQFSNQEGGYQYTGPNRYATGQYSTAAEPDVRVTSDVNITSDAAIQASGQIMGEVSVNFRSETFPLERMVDTDQMMRLQQAQGAGRAAPPPASAGAGLTPPAAGPVLTPAPTAGAPAAG